MGHVCHLFKQANAVSVNGRQTDGQKERHSEDKEVIPVCKTANTGDTTNLPRPAKF